MEERLGREKHGMSGENMSTQWFLSVTRRAVWTEEAQNNWII